MTRIQTGGSSYPGIRRLRRRGRRCALRSTETDLGNEEVNLGRGGDEENVGSANGEVENRVDLDEEEQVMAERYSILPRVREIDGCRCMCVWPKDRISIQRIWHIVKQELSTHGDRNMVCKIAQINQPGSVVRYDIYVERRNFHLVYSRLRRRANVLRWLVKRHQHFWTRRLNRSRSEHNAPNAVRDFRFSTLSKVATWNIHSITEKRNEVGMYLQKEGIDVLALQETWRDSDRWPIRFKGYNVFESVAEVGAPGRNGVAVCVKNHLVAYEVGEVSPYVVTVRVLIGTDEWTIMSIYIPPRGVEYNSARKDAIKHIQRNVQRLIHQDLGAKIAIIGDWNMKLDDIQKKIRKWRLPLLLAPCQGSPFTFMGRATWSAIDHMVITHEAELHARKCHVNRTWDLSDHWPLEIMISGQSPNEGVNNEGSNQQPIGLRIDVKKLRNTQHNIVDDNRWAVLALDDTDGEDNEPLADLLENTVRDICEEMEVIKAPLEEPKGPAYRLTKRAKKAIRKRREAYKHWVNEAAPVKGGPRWERYLECKAFATKAKRQSSQKSWLLHIVNGANKLASNDIHGFWRWVKTTIRKGGNGPSDFGPLQCPTTPQLLLYQPADKLRAWQTNYEQLYADVTGHSRDMQYWAEKFQGPPAQPIQGLNDEPTWVELNAALHKLKTNKAPGRDGILSEFYKLATEDASKPEFDRETPRTEMGKALLRLVRCLYKSGIPSKWNEAWVVSIFKTGDPTDMNNYRGISLIPVIVKLTTSIVTARLTSELESSGYFIKEQSGFRWKEECAGHVCALYEILRRREIEGKNSYVAFIDIRKAYDTVPIEALLRKLFMIGVSGTTLDYFRSLYTDAKVRIKTKYGLSDLIKLLRGLRQGCNASPLLFDIFINDILDELRALGVTVIGLDKKKRIVGLLYADDLVLICGTRSNLRKALEKIQEWGDLHEMTFGISKCGVMGFGETADNKVRSCEWMLNGQRIPVVDKYIYLGIPFTRNLDLNIITKAVVAKGLKALNANRPFLKCLQIPLDIRVRLVKTLIVTVLTQGGELWGMLDERTKGPQKVLNEALRLLVRLRANSTLTSSATLGLEFGIPPISAIVAAARARAFTKFPRLKTVIADLIASPPKSMKQTWVTGTKMWIHKYCRAATGVNSPGDAAALVKTYVWDRYNKAAKSKTCKFYQDNELVSQRKYLTFATYNPTLARGIYWLCRLRVGAVWYAYRLATIRYIDYDYRHKCPFCNEMVAESPEHLLLKCSRWDQYRTQYLGDLLALHNPTWIQLLGGSNLEEDGIEDRRFCDLGGLWCPKKPGHINSDLQIPHHGDENDENLPTCVLVAQYLQKVMPIRFRILHNLMKGPRANADHGMAVLIEPLVTLTPDNNLDVGETEGDIDNRGTMVADSIH